MTPADASLGTSHPSADRDYVLVSGDDRSWKVVSLSFEEHADFPIDLRSRLKPLSRMVVLNMRQMG
jgi:hypothetical protein